MTAIAPAERYTLADWRQWQGDWELIDGAPLAMAPSPSLPHQRVSAALFSLLAAALRDCPRCKALFETDVEFGEDTVVRPDVLVMGFEPEGKRLTRAPALVAEVVSPQTAARDEHAKFALYEREGVALYLLLYPQARRLKLWQRRDGRYLKRGDFHAETIELTIGDCPVALPCARLWQRLLPAAG